MSLFLALLGAALMFTMAPRDARAHERDTQVVEVLQLDAEHVQLTVHGATPGIGSPVTIDGCTERETPGAPDPLARTAIITLACTGSVPGKGVHLRRDAARAPSPTLVVYALAQPPGTSESQSLLLSSQHPDGSLGASSAWAAFPRWLEMGALHVASGADHLLFLACLVAHAMLAGGLSARRIALLATGFTLGHATTLILASMGLVHVHVLWAEACIALTLLLAGRTVLRGVLQSGDGGAVAPPTLQGTLVFGGVHGAGVASSLLSAGLPDAGQPTALFGFNIGVELAQLTAVAAIGFLLVTLASRAPRALRGTQVLLSTGTGIFGSYLFLIRVIPALRR